MAFLSDATNRKVDSTALEDLNYNEFLSEPGITEAASSEIPPPPGITVTVHLDSNPKMVLKIAPSTTWRLVRLLQVSNSDLHNVINIGHNVKIVIINKGKIMRKSKPTVRHLTTGYLISTGTIRENDIATR